MIVERVHYDSHPDYGVAQSDNFGYLDAVDTSFGSVEQIVRSNESDTDRGIRESYQLAVKRSGHLALVGGAVDSPHQADGYQYLDGAKKSAA
jgi:hypothetical protein